jgi:hypothetical protein
MRFLLTTAVLLATAAGVAAASASASHHSPARTGPLELLAAAGKSVTVKGLPVSGLYPGAVKPLIVTVKNLNGFTIKVPTVKTKVAAVTTVRGCAGTTMNLVVTHVNKTLTIKKKKSAKLPLAVTMPRTVANVCQGARFSITVTVKAVKG